MDMVDSIMAYESGDMTESAMLAFFSTLVKTGNAWTLQGHYGRTAQALIQAGYLDKAGNILRSV